VKVTWEGLYLPLNHEGGLMQDERLDVRLTAKTANPEVERPTAPVDDCLRWLEKDTVLLTHLVDQLDTRLAAVLGDGVPRPGDDPEPPAPGTSGLVTALAILHVRLSGELGRLERLMNRVEVG
jgi:hypothetical protein